MIKLKKNEYCLIDGFGLIFKAYYSHARNPLFTSDGRPTSAIFGFSSMMIKILNDFKPNNVVVALDAGSDTFRKDKYSEYKANRATPPDDLKVQFETIFEIIDLMGITKIMRKGFEADDIIGTISKKLTEKNQDSFIISGDRDLFQLITDRTRIFYLSGGFSKSEVYDEAHLFQKMELSPSQIVDYKGLAGDSADNIPGVRGIGDKTAKSLLKEYGNLENIYEKIDEIGGKKREKLLKDKEMAFLSKELATIKCDMDLEIDLEEFEWHGLNFPKLSQLYKDFELNSLIKRSEKLEFLGVQQECL